jgi:beta-glucosidase
VDPWKDKPINKAAVVRSDVLINRLFIEPVLGMGYATKDLPALKHIERYVKPEDEKNMAFDFDFIGLQNYTRTVVKYLGLVPMLHAINIPSKKLGHPLTEMGWEVYPEGMYRIIKQFAAYKGVKKILITENGVAFKDEVVNGEINDQQRIQFLKDYLRNVLKAKREGVNIGGYFIWSFTDNFEWAEGFRPKFGLVGVDFKTEQRIVKASGKWFSEFLKG